VTKTQTKTQNKKTDASAGAKATRLADREGDADVVANDVRLVGRLSGEPSLLELPSGDALVTFRISVPRGAPPRAVSGAGGSSQRVDSVPCTAWSPRLRRSVLTWRAGDLVEVEGAVRCRFYQAGGATRSRVEVEASAARIMRRSSAA
jgi:single-strand DNA-binding protein